VRVSLHAKLPEPERLCLAAGGRMTIDLQELMTQLQAATAAGASAAEMHLREATGIDVDTTRARANKRDVVTRSLRIRAWLADGRSGEAGGAPEKYAEIAQKAVAAASKSAPDQGAAPVERLAVSSRGLGIDDRRFPTLAPADRIEVITSAERGARGVDKAILTRDFKYSDRRVRRAVVSTNGLNVEEWSTLYTAEGLANAGDVTIRESIAARSFASISSLPFGVVLARRVMALQAPQASPEGVKRVMMPPRVVGPLFARLATAFDIASLEAGACLFANGYREGRSVVDSRIHLIDDAQLPGGLRSYAFDDEGVPPVPLALLREGIPDARYIDLPTGRRREIRPSGHWIDGALRPANLLLRSGTRSMSALLSEHQTVRTFVLDHVASWDGLDLATGAFEVVASGFVQRGNDTIEGPVRNVRLSGNVLTMLSNLVEIASDTDRIDHVDAPGMLVEGVTIG